MSATKADVDDTNDCSCRLGMKQTSEVTPLALSQNKTQLHKTTLMSPDEPIGWQLFSLTPLQFY